MFIYYQFDNICWVVCYKLQRGRTYVVGCWLDAFGPSESTVSSWAWGRIEVLFSLGALEGMKRKPITTKITDTTITNVTRPPTKAGVFDTESCCSGPSPFTIPGLSSFLLKRWTSCFSEQSELVQFGLQWHESKLVQSPLLEHSLPCLSSGHCFAFDRSRTFTQVWLRHICGVNNIIGSQQAVRPSLSSTSEF